MMNRGILVLSILVASCSLRSENRVAEPTGQAQNVSRVTEPRIRVTAVREANGTVVFGFSSCNASVESISRLDLAKIEDITDRSPALVCELHSGEAARLGGKWRYGEGNRSLNDRPCAAIALGRHYRVWASGAGWGFLEFAMREDGAIQVLSNFCDQDSRKTPYDD